MSLDIEALSTLLARYAGAEIHIEDAGGYQHVVSDVDTALDIIEACDDPWIDLVGGDGAAVGLTLPGDPNVVDPAPSLVLNGGMAFIIDGEKLPGQQRGKHMVSAFDVVGDYPIYSLDELAVSTPGSEMEIVLSSGRHRMEKQGQWKPTKSVFGQFSSALQQHTPGKKDGPCFLQGEAVGGTRKAMAMIANYIIGVDLDSGKPLEDVMDAIIDAGLEAVIYTTHSHLKTTSQIKRDHFLKWTDGEDPSPELIAEYLQIKKGMIPEVTTDIVIVDDSFPTEEGIVILVEHAPVPKFRAVFPLHEPFVFGKRGGAQKDAIIEWKERYAGFATKLGFFFDETCADPARLFYLPRHKKGDVHGSWWIAGKPVNLDEYERVKVKRDRRTRASGGPSNPWADQDDGDQDDRNRYMVGDFSLVGWAKDNARFFEVESMLSEVAPEMLRENRGGKAGVHVECPFEAEHSTFGGGGSFVVNASDNYEEGYDGGFTFTCVHDACSHRDRLDMLKGCIEEELITLDDLKNPAFKMEVEIEEDEVEEERPKPSGPKPKKSSAYEEPADDSHLSDEDRNLAYFNKHYAVVSTTGGAKILVEPGLDPDDDEAEDDVVFYNQSDVALIEKNRFVFVSGKGGKTERLEGFKLWLEHPDRRFYKKVRFAPGKELPDNIYNLWRGFPVQPIKGDWSMLRGHLFENICESDPVLFDWFMTWMAHLIQHPEMKPGSTIVVTGGKGTGKSTLFEYLGMLVGRHSVTANSRKHIVGQFNSHIATALLLICEEAFWAADPQSEGTLKDMITAREMLIEKKGHDPIKTKNFTRLALISNEDWVVPASLKDERRFGVFHCSDARQGEWHVVNFWGPLREQMINGGLEAMMYELLHYKPETGSFACLFNPPATKHLAQQQIQSLDGLSKFMLSLMETGIYEPSNENIDTIELNLRKPTIVYAQNLRACVEDAVRFKFNSDKAKTGYEDISKAAVEWFGAEDRLLTPESGINRRRAIIFPPLEESRLELQERKGLTVTVISEMS